MENVIEANDVTRYYGDKRGVQGLNIAIRQGSILGLLGENGCGKSTTMRLAMGMIFPNAGTITTLGIDPTRMAPEVRSRIGWMADNLAVPARMTLAEVMKLQSLYYPTWNWDMALRLSKEFSIASHDRYGALSFGQKRRFMLILVLSQMPELLVLDEPAGGLDPAVRRQFMDILIEQATSRPMTIIMSSHILSDMERLVDSVAFMKDGKITRQGDLEDMRTRVKRLCFATNESRSLVEQRFSVIQEDNTGGAWRAVVEDFDPALLEGLPVQVEHLNLEELFIVYNGLVTEPKSVAA